MPIQSNDPIDMALLRPLPSLTKAAPKPAGLYAMDDTDDPSQAIWDALGDLTKAKVPGPLVLVATYVRPNKTKGGILLADETRAEDEYQGKVGLVLKLGPCAFEENDKTKFNGVTAKVGDWVAYSPMDGMAMKIRGVHCRMIEDVQVKFIVPVPDMLL